MPVKYETGRRPVIAAVVAGAIVSRSPLSSSGSCSNPDRRCHTPTAPLGLVTDDEVLELAAAEGFRLVDKIAEHTGTESIGWRRGDDDRWPCNLERRQAITGCATGYGVTACSSRRHGYLYSAGVGARHTDSEANPAHYARRGDASAERSRGDSHERLWLPHLARHAGITQAKPQPTLASTYAPSSLRARSAMFVRSEIATAAATPAEHDRDDGEAGCTGGTSSEECDDREPMPNRIVMVPSSVVPLMLMLPNTEFTVAQGLMLPTTTPAAAPMVTQVPIVHCIEVAAALAAPSGLGVGGAGVRSVSVLWVPLPRRARSNGRHPSSAARGAPSGPTTNRLLSPADPPPRHGPRPAGSCLAA